MEQTLIILKPDATEKNIIGECLRRFENSGLKIKKLEMRRLTMAQIQKFYGHLKGKISNKMFKNIAKFMTSSPVVLAILEGKEAIQKVKEICGPTNPKEAPKGTLRGDFSKDDLIKNKLTDKETRNVIHRSATLTESRQERKILGF